MIYLDSAIMVKMWVNEPDSEHWRLKLVREDLASSMLIVPEVKSALRQKVHAGTLRAAVARSVWDAFSESIEGGAMQTVPLGESIVQRAVELLDELPKGVLLRSLDALHLATAQSIGRCQLATTDRRMIAAANHLSIPVFTA